MGKNKKKQGNQDKQRDSPQTQNVSGQQSQQQQQHREPTPTAQQYAAGSSGQQQQGPGQQQQGPGQQQQRQQRPRQQQQEPRQQQQEPRQQQQEHRQQQQGPGQQQQGPKQQQRQQRPRQQQQQGPGQQQPEYRQQQQEPRQQQQEPRQQQQGPGQQQQGPGQQQQRQQRPRQQQQEPRQQQQQGPGQTKPEYRQQYQELRKQQQEPKQQQKGFRQQQQHYERSFQDLSISSSPDGGGDAWRRESKQQQRGQKKEVESVPKKQEERGQGDQGAWGTSRSMQHKTPSDPAQQSEVKSSAWGLPTPHPKAVTGLTEPSEQKLSDKKSDSRTGGQRQTDISRTQSKSTIGRKTADFEYIPPTGIALAKGTEGRKTTVEANYLDINIQNMIEKAYQYDIVIEPDKPKKLLRSAFREYCKLINNEGIGLAFDGNKIVYSPQILSKNAQETKEVKVQDSRGEKSFKITLKSTGCAEIDMSSLKNYQTTRIFDKPMRAIQCLDVILSSAVVDSNIAVKGGRSYFVQPKSLSDLKDGYELWTGLFQAAILGDKPFLNVDVCHKAFPKSLSLITWLAENTKMRIENDEVRGWDERNLYDFLKGIDVEYRPPKELNSRPRIYKFNSLKNSSERETFKDENNRTLTVKQYFNNKGVTLKYPKLPCIHLGPKDKTIYIPLEFCVIPGGQAINKKAGANQVRELIRYAATSTSMRKAKIFDLFNLFNYNNNPTIKRFNVSLGSNFIKVDARILDAPGLIYSSCQVNPRDGKWDDQGFLETSRKKIKWAVLNTDNRMRPNDVDKFAKMFADLARKKRMDFDDYVLENETDTRRLESKLRVIKERFDFVIVIISDFMADSYPNVKKNAELKCGMLTQCIKSNTVLRKCNVSTLSNILLKVNAKLNGLNHKIKDNQITSIVSNNQVMFIGADVTHPAPGENIPSVVGVASSFDPAGFKYCMRWRLQESKVEIIQDMKEIVSEQLYFYKMMNGGKLPTKLIYYRDGVSDGQIKAVRQVELMAIENAYRDVSKANMKPIIICFVVQKRHRTRFFPLRPKPSDRFENVDPGTIIDKTITHPAENQFFLVSHKSIQGVAKPTKYIIIRDDDVFRNEVDHVNDLQAMTYNLCHMFTRCNRTVSYPAPTYYAHLAAYRGRVYIHGERIDMRILEKEYNRRQININLVQANPMYFV